MRKKLNWVNPPRPDPGRRKRITLNFFSHFFVVPRKVLWRPLRFSWNLLWHHKEVWNLYFNLYFNTTFWNARGGRVEKWCLLIFVMKYVKYDQAKITIKRYGFFCSKNYMYFARTSCNEENKWYRQIQGYWIANARLLLPSMRYITE